MVGTLEMFCRIRWGLSFFARVRWGFHTLATAVLLALTLVAIQQPATSPLLNGSATGTDAGVGNALSPALARLAANDPDRRVEAIVQLQRDVKPASVLAAVRAAGGRVTRDLHLINGFGVHLRAADARKLAADSRIRWLSLNAPSKPSGITTSRLATAYPFSIRATTVWNGAGARGSRGAGVGVAVIDTGIQGNLPDFRVSQSNSRSRVIASVVVNPDAKTPADKFGHGTHVASLIAGNGTARPTSDRLYGKYVGVAPEANLISIKASDDEGNATTMDVIDGLQFAVDHKKDYNIEVVNLSLNSETAESYKTDPLDAAAEQAWNAGIVVVAAAGNRGSAPDAVNYAPANDPFVITVGAVDDRGTADTSDDAAESWSSTGTTQDGFAKPEVLAPGSHMVAALSPGSAIEQMCPTCVVDGQYFRMGGTSMATGVVSGAAALALANYGWTPNQVKSAIRTNLRQVPGVGAELDADATFDARGSELTAPNTYERNTYINSATGAIDYTRSRWSRSRWSTAAGSLTAGWSQASWVCITCGAASDPVSTSRSRWSRSRWSMSFVK